MKEKKLPEATQLLQVINNNNKKQIDKINVYLGIYSKW
jgi:hypothetical protein